MKRIYYTLFLLSIVFLASCEESEILSPNKIVLEKDSISISSLEQTLKIRVITSTDFSVTSDCDWLSVEKKYSAEESELELLIKENLDSLNSRKSIVTIKSEKNDATAILYIYQAYKSIIRLLTKPLVISSSQQDIPIQVKSNCDYEVLIPKNASDWIALSGTKAVSESCKVLLVTKNDTYQRRTANVLFNNKSDGVQDTLKIIQDEGFQSLRLLLKENPKTTIFYEALVATHLSDTLMNYYDLSYSEPGYDSTYTCLEMTGSVKVHYSTGYQNYDNGQFQRVVWPNERLFKYTLFAVTDSVLKEVYNITDALEDGIDGGISLKSFAKSIYNDPAHLNDNDTLSTSPLYKLMAYHILPEWLERSLMNFTNNYIVEHYKDACPDSIDMEDFYETLQHSIMRISTPYDNGNFSNLGKASNYNGKYIFINRKGTVAADNLQAEGVRIWNSDEVQDNEIALNGGFYYVDSLLVFDSHTKKALNTRIRVMCNTLSPDFTNSGARGRMRQALGDKPTTFAVYAFKEGYCKNVSASEQTLYVVRYQDKEWDVMYHDQMDILGDYDIKFRLPPVPESGTYEIRVFGNAQSDANYRKTRSVVQFMLGEEDYDSENIRWTPCGNPVDMATMITDDAVIGSVLDSKIEGSTPEEKEMNIRSNDKAIRNRGYMKAPAGFAMGTSLSDRLRNHDVCFRKIICETYMEEGKDYYLRLKKVDSGNTIVSFNFIEIVPFFVYSGLYGDEDRY